MAHQQKVNELKPEQIEEIQRQMEAMQRPVPLDLDTIGCYRLSREEEGDALLVVTSHPLKKRLSQIFQVGEADLTLVHIGEKSYGLPSLTVKLVRLEEDVICSRAWADLKPISDLVREFLECSERLYTGMDLQPEYFFSKIRDTALFAAGESFVERIEGEWETVLKRQKKPNPSRAYQRETEVMQAVILCHLSDLTCSALIKFDCQSILDTHSDRKKFLNVMGGNAVERITMFKKFSRLYDHGPIGGFEE